MYEVNLQRGGIKDEEIVAKCKQNRIQFKKLCTRVREHIYHILTETMTYDKRTLIVFVFVFVCVCVPCASSLAHI